MTQELKPEQLKRTYDPNALGMDTTASLEPLTGIIGQQRAVNALRFGLNMQQHGFHIYVAGPAGIGKMTAVQTFLEEVAAQKPIPSDWCYVNNFEDTYQPKVVKLPSGWGRQFQTDMKNLIDGIRVQLPTAFDSEAYSTKRDGIVKALDKQREVVVERINDQAAQAGFLLQISATGISLTPLLGGRGLTDTEFQALPISARDDYRSRRTELQESLKADFKQLRNLERAAHEEILKLDQEVALYVVGEGVNDLLQKYHTYADVVEFITAARQDILQNIDTFKSDDSASIESGAPNTPFMRELPFRKYRVNVLVDNSKTTGAPVVVVQNPSYTNLFGLIEKETQYGALYTDHAMIKPGALHRANGGFVVIRTEDLLSQFSSWDSLKRALRNSEIAVEEMGERLGFLTTKTVQPQSIPLETKVVLVGPANVYYSLYEYDSDFAELFKIKADFDTEMPSTESNIKDFMAFISALCQRENLLHLEKTAVARMLEYSARLAEDQRKLSTHFGKIATLIRESSYWAEQDGATTITDAHVRKARDEQVYRASLIQDRGREMMRRGTILIDTSGMMVGQVNGLAVYSLGDYEFGRPSRITATVEPGMSGIVDIERQVALGGPIHSKGVMILSGYLVQKYARERSITLAAQLVFEQNYNGIEGDSASSAELYVLLSVLSGLPLKQSIAVTGSVNQHGTVQAIGGINQKIEGFYDLCNVRGLTGDQGVLFPASNIQELMLNDDIIEAVRAGKFHLWPVQTIDEGIEIMTGVPAGERTEAGRYPEGTVNGRVAQRLRDMSESR